VNRLLAELKKRTYLEIDLKMILFWLLIFSLLGLVYLAILGYNPSYGENSSNNISIKKFEKIGDEEYRLSIKYCNMTNSNPLGILVSSKEEVIPVPIGAKLGEGKCAIYATKIQADSKMTIKTSTFQKGDLDYLIKQFEIKKKNLRDQWILAEQKLKMQNSVNKDSDKIASLKNQIKDLKSQIKSQKSSLTTLISLK